MWVLSLLEETDASLLQPVVTPGQVPSNPLTLEAEEPSFYIKSGSLSMLAAANFFFSYSEWAK